VTCGSFSPGPPDSSTNKTYRHDITELLLKVALSTIKQTNKTKGVIRIPEDPEKNCRKSLTNFIT
jgi:hypothetical protein